MDFTISKMQLNHYLKSTIPIAVVRFIFEHEIRNSEINLQTIHERFMKWKDLDFENFEF